MTQSVTPTLVALVVPLMYEPRKGRAEPSGSFRGCSLHPCSRRGRGKEPARLPGTWLPAGSVHGLAHPWVAFS